MGRTNYSAGFETTPAQVQVVLDAATLAQITASVNAQFGGDIANNTSKNAAQTAQIDDLFVKHSQQTQDIANKAPTTRVNGIQSSVTTNTNKIGALETSNVNLHTKYDLLDGRIASNAATLSTLRTDFNEANARLTNGITTINSIDAGQLANIAENAGLIEQILDSNVAALESNIADIRTQIQEFSGTGVSPVDGMYLNNVSQSLQLGDAVSDSMSEHTEFVGFKGKLLYRAAATLYGYKPIFDGLLTAGGLESVGGDVLKAKYGNKLSTITFENKPNSNVGVQNVRTEEISDLNITLSYDFGRREEDYIEMTRGEIVEFARAVYPDGDFDQRWANEISRLGSGEPINGIDDPKFRMYFPGVSPPTGGYKDFTFVDDYAVYRLYTVTDLNVVSNLELFTDTNRGLVIKSNAPYRNLITVGSQDEPDKFHVNSRGDIKTNDITFVNFNTEQYDMPYTRPEPILYLNPFEAYTQTEFQEQKYYVSNKWIQIKSGSSKLYHKATLDQAFYEICKFLYETDKSNVDIQTHVSDSNLDLISFVGPNVAFSDASGTTEYDNTVHNGPPNSFNTRTIPGDVSTFVGSSLNDAISDFPNVYDKLVKGQIDFDTGDALSDANLYVIPGNGLEITAYETNQKRFNEMDVKFVNKPISKGDLLYYFEQRLVEDLSSRELLLNKFFYERWGFENSNHTLGLKDGTVVSGIQNICIPVIEMDIVNTLPSITRIDKEYFKTWILYKYRLSEISTNISLTSKESNQSIINREGNISPALSVSTTHASPIDSVFEVSAVNPLDRTEQRKVFSVMGNGTIRGVKSIGTAEERVDTLYMNSTVIFKDRMKFSATNDDNYVLQCDTDGSLFMGTDKAIDVEPGSDVVSFVKTNGNNSIAAPTKSGFADIQANGLIIGNYKLTEVNGENTDVFSFVKTNDNDLDTPTTTGFADIQAGGLIIGNYKLAEVNGELVVQKLNDSTKKYSLDGVLRAGGLGVGEEFTVAKNNAGNITVKNGTEEMMALVNEA